jgi:hypothetical protein
MGLNAPGSARSDLIFSSIYPLAKGSCTECPLRVEMRCPDSINDIYIDTFPMIRKQMEI